MTNLFLRMIINLRKEEVMLYDNLLCIAPKEAEEVVYFLETEYQDERKSYPYKAPQFDAQAALWAAKTSYFAAQLILYRQNTPEELQQILPKYQGTISAAAILSADLTLRFIPNMIVQLKLLNPEDDLIHILEKQLITWHYSAVGHRLETDEIDFSTITTNPCLYQLYVDRVIERKVHYLAKEPKLQKGIIASLGWYKDIFWKDLNT